VPALVMHGDDDQIVPYADSGPLSAKLQRLPARHAYDPSRDHHRRPVGLREIVTTAEPHAVRYAEVTSVERFASYIALSALRMSPSGSSSKFE
jgi:hypothetical protein